jgi:polysaccharide biosynthesis transport protein
VLLPLGAVLGLALGFGTAYIRDRADDRVRDRDDLEDCLGEPVLAVVPRTSGTGQATVFATDPGSPAADAFRYLRAHVEPLLASQPGAASAGTASTGTGSTGTGSTGKVLLVTGAQRQEGRSSVASNLAAALAQSGRRVLLVDADLRHPSLGEVYGIASRPGLTELLAGQAGLADVVSPTGRQGLQLITAGRQAGGPTDVLNSDSLARVITELRSAADVVVVDSGPAVSVSEPVTIAQVSDLVLQVANVRCTLRTATRAAAQELRTSGTITLVGVLTGAPGSASIQRPQLRPAPQSLPAPAVKPDLAATRDARAQVAPASWQTEGVSR